MGPRGAFHFSDESLLITVLGLCGWKFFTWYDLFFHYKGQANKCMQSTKPRLPKLQFLSKSIFYDPEDCSGFGDFGILYMFRAWIYNSNYLESV